MAGDTTGAPRAQTHYERIGGASTIVQAVDRFYRLVLEDPALAPYFADTNMAQLKRHQVLLLSQVLGGPADYDGRELEEAHSGLGIRPEHFARVAGYLVEVLEDMGADAEVVDAVRTTVGGLEPAIVANDDGGDGPAPAPPDDHDGS